MEASHAREGSGDALEIGLDIDMTLSPRVFLHWPSALSGSDHVPLASEVLLDIIDAQLDASLHGGEAPSRGNNDLAYQ
jgi:hypothetical protein